LKESATFTPWKSLVQLTKGAKMRKLIWVIWGITILGVTPLAQAKEITPSHFSMYELKNKISEIILDKYPDSRVDYSALSIDVTDVKCSEDPSKDHDSCVGLDLKPRPDSADFTLRLSMGVDLSQTQQMFFAPEPYVVLKTTVGKRYDLKVIPERVGVESPEVPNNSWTYNAFDKLVNAEVVKGMPSPWNMASPNYVHRLLTRFECAVAIARLLDNKTERAKDSDEVKQLISQLAVEFAPEVAELCIPTKPSDVPIGGMESWPYDVINQLNILGIKVEVSQYSGTVKPLTRYEFAVAIARLLEQKDKRAKDSPKVKVLIAKLALEFEPELRALNYPLDHNQMVADLAAQNIVWPPRYEYLQLDLTCGKKFDEKLRQEIENTIAKYVAHHSDLN